MIARRISFAERLEDFLFDRGLDDAVGMRYRRSATRFAIATSCLTIGMICQGRRAAVVILRPVIRRWSVIHSRWQRVIIGRRRRDRINRRRKGIIMSGWCCVISWDG